MKISTKGRYALMVMIHLARNYPNDTYTPLSDIAKRENVSVKYLEKIMLNFNKTNYLKSSRGIIGGYKLSFEPKYYKIGDILRIAEGDIEVVSCINSHECPKKDKCLTFTLWDDLNNLINNYLDSKTLQDYI